MTLILTPWRASAALTCSLLGALIVLPLMSFSPPSQAGEVLHWKDAWVRSMPPAAQVTAAYGQLMNHGERRSPLPASAARLAPRRKCMMSSQRAISGV